MSGLELLQKAIPLPSLSRSDRDFIPEGGYWRGSVWMPTSYMVIKALDAHGDWALARSLARRTVFGMADTWRDFEPHTIWECYSPTQCKPATYAKKPGYSRPDFCGWSALGPISLFIEDVLGVKQADAFANRLVCDFVPSPAGRIGVRNYRFGNVVCDIVATAGEIEVESNAPFTLIADGHEFTVAVGGNCWKRKFCSSQRHRDTETANECRENNLRVSASLRERNHFGDWRDSLPRPVFDERPELVDFLLSQDYFMSVFELTQRQYELVVGDNPSFFTNRQYYATRPLEFTSCEMFTAAESGFLAKATAMFGKTLNLPTEAQWEFAAKAMYDGTGYPSGLELTQANLGVMEGITVNRGHSGYPDAGRNDATNVGGTWDVGRGQPNPYGLYNMFGNVSERTLDASHRNLPSKYNWTDGSPAVRDPYNTQYQLASGHVVYKGGNYVSNVAGNQRRSAWRGSSTKSARVLSSQHPLWGFRVICPAD